MIAVDDDDLARVCGGQNTTSVDTPIASSTTTRSDYAYCVDQVAKQTAAAYPDTRPRVQLLGVIDFPVPGTNDDNATTRATKTVENMVTACGQPPP
jgi:hypothetical protein